MTDAIKTGTILIEKAHPCRSPYGSKAALFGWLEIRQQPRSERAGYGDPQAGWTFFFMAGEIKITAFGFDKEAGGAQGREAGNHECRIAQM